MGLNVGLDVNPPLVNSCWANCSTPGILVEITLLLCAKYNYMCLFSDADSKANLNDMDNLVPYVSNGIINISVPFFTATTERLKLVDFSQVVFYNQIVLVTKMPRLSQQTLSDISIFNWKVWICLFVLTVIVGMLIACSEVGECKNVFSSAIFNIFELIYLLLNQAQRLKVRRSSSQILTIFFAFFALIITTIYSGKLLAKLLSRHRFHTFTDFESFMACMEMQQCKLIAQSNSLSFISQFYNANNTDFERIRLALDKNPVIVLPNAGDILDKIIQTEEYNLVWMTIEMIFYGETDGNANCSFVVIDTEMLDAMQFPVQKISGLLQKINKFVKEFKGSGIYSRIYNKYIKHNELCLKSNDYPRGHALSVSTGYSLLLIIFIGSILSIAIFGLEKYYTCKCSYAIAMFIDVHDKH